MGSFHPDVLDNDGLVMRCKTASAARDCGPGENRKRGIFFQHEATRQP